MNAATKDKNAIIMMIKRREKNASHYNLCNATAFHAAAGEREGETKWGEWQLRAQLFIRKNNELLYTKVLHW